MSRIAHDRHSITDINEAVIREYIEDKIHDVHTSHPAEVISIRDETTFDGIKRTVAVRLGVMRDVKGLAKQISPLLYVPVIYPASKKYGMVWPIEVGDTGLVAFSETSIDQWLQESGGTTVNPRDLRMHDYSDGFFIPHVVQFGSSGDYPEIKDGEVCIYSRGSGDKEVKIILKDDGKFCIETANGSFTDKLVQILTIINTHPSLTGIISTELAELESMVC